MITVDTTRSEIQRMICEILKETREIKEILRCDLLEANDEETEDIPETETGPDGIYFENFICKDPDAMKAMRTKKAEEKKVDETIAGILRMVDELAQKVKEKETEKEKKIEIDDSTRDILTREAVRLIDSLNVLGLLNAITYLQELYNDEKFQK